MNWGCPHLEKAHCQKLKKLCYPTQKGCVLRGRVKLEQSSMLSGAKVDPQVLKDSPAKKVSKDPLRKSRSTKRAKPLLEK